jgi:hypothetical protein
MADYAFTVIINTMLSLFTPTSANFDSQGGIGNISDGLDIYIDGMLPETTAADWLDSTTPPIPQPVGPFDIHMLPAELASGSVLWTPGILELIVQPSAHQRIRYHKEKRRTALVGIHARSVPTVGVALGWKLSVPDGIKITATVVSSNVSKSSGLPLPHHHYIQDAESAGKQLKGGVCEFTDLVVVRGERVPVDENIESHSIRILFTANFVDSTGQSHVIYAMSNPIYSSELKIVKMSHQQVCAVNGSEVILMTSKVTPSPLHSLDVNIVNIGISTQVKKTSPLYIRITDGNPREPGSTPPPPGWTLDKHNRLTTAVTPSYFHYQYAVSVTLPPYWQPGVATPRMVDIRLVDATQESIPVTFEYI